MQRDISYWRMLKLKIKSAATKPNVFAFGEMVLEITLTGLWVLLRATIYFQV